MMLWKRDARIRRHISRFITSVQLQVVKPLEVKYVAMVLLTANSSDNREHTDVCFMHFSPYSSWVCGQFIGMSEVPSEKEVRSETSP